MKRKLLSIAVMLCIVSITFGQANQTLSNLTPPTAVNADLLPSVTNTKDIGSDSAKWRCLYLSGFLSLDNSMFISNNGGPDNCYVGKRAGRYITTGAANTGIGTQALFNSTTGYKNTAVGYQSMFNSINAVNCSALGYQSLYSDSSGAGNVAVGNFALFNNKAGNWNTAIGFNAMLNSGQIVPPPSAPWQSSNNVAMGNGAMNNNTIGWHNVAIGTFSLSGNTTGSLNTSVGGEAMKPLVTGRENVAVGYQAGYSDNNIKGTSVGAYARAANGFNNATALGADAVATASDMVRIGSTTITSIGGQVNWTAFSDGRYKKNLSESVPGLQFINQLRPVTYNFDVPKMNAAIEAIAPSPGKRTADDEKSMAAQSKVVYTGFVAQEVEAAAKKIGYTFSGVDAPKNSNGFYGLRYAEFVVPLVKAVQELSKKTDEVDALKKQLTSQQQQTDEMKKQLQNQQQQIAELKAMLQKTAPAVTLK